MPALVYLAASALGSVGRNCYDKYYPSNAMNSKWSEKRSNDYGTCVRLQVQGTLIALQPPASHAPFVIDVMAVGIARLEHKLTGM